MKCARPILLTYLLLPSFLFAQSGATCGTAIPLILDNVIRNYATSSSTGTTVFCTYAGTSPVTWFSFTTNGPAQCPLLSVSASDGLSCEIALYSSCNNSASPIASSSMCLYDGNGLWAPAMPSTLATNSTYYLRIKTSTSCTISIGGQSYLPSNDDCAGAFSISTVGIADNNSCHQAGPGVTPPQLCASSLENTAFYQFYVDATGTCLINIANISCDNGTNNNNNGFQIGFFTGSCASLTWLSCTSGSGSFVQATTPVLAGGTKVYVAIDGNAGSNCAYSIGGINILGVLSATLKNFSGWQRPNSNLLKWTTLDETDGYYELERSDNGIDFIPIGRINSKGPNTEVYYSYEDLAPLEQNLYRLRRTNHDGKVSMSHFVKISRKEISSLQVKLTSPTSDFVDINLIANMGGRYSYKIVSTQGHVLLHGEMFCNKGNNRFQKQISDLLSGQYYFIVNDTHDMPVSRPFIKMD